MTHEIKNFLLLFAQVKLNSLVRHLKLPKSSAESLAFRLKKTHLLENDVHLTFYQSRHEEILSFFTEERKLVYCRNVKKLLNKLN